MSDSTKCLTKDESKQFRMNNIRFRINENLEKFPMTKVTTSNSLTVSETRELMKEYELAGWFCELLTDRDETIISLK